MANKTFMKLREKIKYLLLAYKNHAKFFVDIISEYCKFFKRKHPFASKIILSIGFAILVYFTYMAALVNLLYGIIILSKFKSLFALMEIISMILILGLPLATTIYMIKRFYPILGCEKYFRWLSDCVAVLVPMVFLYDTYYHLNDITKMFLLSKWFLGWPFVILIIRAVLSFYKLKQEES